MTMRVEIYLEINGKWTFDGESDVSECFPDDPDSLALAVYDLQREGEHYVGGGSAPYFKLVRRGI